MLDNQHLCLMPTVFHNKLSITKEKGKESEKKRKTEKKEEKR